jgi:hypothetical protein
LTWQVVGSLAAAIVVAGCTNDDPREEGDDVAGTAELLLTQDDVPGAISAEDVADLERFSVCSPITRPEGRLSTFADSSAIREIEVETAAGAATVTVAAYEGMSASTRETMIFSNLENGVEVCTRDSPIERGESLVEVMTPLDGLPDGALGYTSRISDKGTPEIVERTFAAVDGTVLVVGARHVGDDKQTGVDIHELLSAAIEKMERVAQNQDA